GDVRYWEAANSTLGAVIPWGSITAATRNSSEPQNRKKRPRGRFRETERWLPTEGSDTGGSSDSLSLAKRGSSEATEGCPAGAGCAGETQHRRGGIVWTHR